MGFECSRPFFLPDKLHNITTRVRYMTYKRLRRRLRITQWNVVSPICTNMDGFRLHCDPSVFPTVCLSVCSMPLSQKRCVLELCLLQNTNGKPHWNPIHQSPWSYCRQKWPIRPGVRKKYVTSQIWQKPSEIERCLLLHVNSELRRLPIISLIATRNGRNDTRTAIGGRHVVSPPSGRHLISESKISILSAFQWATCN